MKLHIKNMVCQRCIGVVKEIAIKIGFSVDSIQLGEIEFDSNNINKTDVELFRIQLESAGFELLDNDSSRLIEKIKLSIQAYVNEELDNDSRKKLSLYLKDAIGIEYGQLSSLFSTTNGSTIEHYFVELRIEKVKELLLNEEMAIKEIAFKLGYSSVAHLSGQFKKETGLTPGYFRKLKDTRQRKSLDEL